MKDRPNDNLMVSHPASGFNINLPLIAAEILGGVGTPVRCSSTMNKDDTMTITIRRSRSKRPKLHIREVSRTTNPTRIVWGVKSTPPIKTRFAHIYLPWKIGEDGESIVFTIPRIAQLRKAHTKTKTKATAKKPLLNFKTLEETDLEKKVDTLTDLLTQVNSILSENPDVAKEVRRRMQHTD